MGDAAATFDRQAHGYDDARRRLIPPYEAFYGAAVEAVGLAGAEPRRVLDLGAGTGLLAGAVAAVWPQAELTLVDGATAMLERARETLGAGRFSYREADLAEPLPPGPWDAIVSALAIHHLDDAGKRDLFGRVRAALREGGVFVNAEQVDGPTPALTELYRNWHRRRARQAGSSEAEWAGAEERMAFDRCASVDSQLRWLREAGFADVDCLFKDHRFAVMVARR